MYYGTSKQMYSGQDSFITITMSASRCASCGHEGVTHITLRSERVKYKNFLTRTLDRAESFFPHDDERVEKKHSPLCWVSLPPFIHLLSNSRIHQRNDLVLSLLLKGHTCFDGCPFFRSRVTSGRQHMCEKECRLLKGRNAKDDILSSNVTGQFIDSLLGLQCTHRQEDDNLCKLFSKKNQWWLGQRQKV
ncbi:hypothetical protein TNCV_1152921 [Trichonephila clavipes]|nr:hypothetical protein TNCV_1152921 [Trichonephila clavipes]